MDTVIQSQTNGDTVVTPVTDANTASEIYASITTPYISLLKQETIYPNEEHDSSVSNEDYQSALECLNDFDQKCNPQQNDVVDTNQLAITPNIRVRNFGNLNELNKQIQHNEVDTDHAIFKTTDDESMAVEALRQLGGMYNNVVSEEQNLPMLTCNLCNTKFQTTADLNAHSVTCSIRRYKIYKCGYCSNEFETENYFNHHICTRLPCKHCNETFQTNLELNTHLKFKHNETQPYQCEFCCRTFFRHSSLANHLKSHRNLPVQFVRCDRKSKNPTKEPALQSGSIDANNSSIDPLSNWNFNYPANSLQVEEAHEVTIENDGLIVSNEEFPQNEITIDKLDPNVKVEEIPLQEDIERNILFHIIPQTEVTIESDNKKPHQCTHCNMSFTREKALISHLKLHSIDWEATFECEHCGESFSTENAKMQHFKSCVQSVQKQSVVNLNTEIPKRQKTKTGKHACLHCDKRFVTKQKMFRHMWIHRKKSYTCEHCAMVFEIQTDLDKHRIAQHPADSPYVCHECGKSFASRQGLWEHGHSHSDKSVGGYLACTKCSKTFSSRQGYLIHQRSHTGERPYGCRYCLKAFRDGGTLRKHERIHTGERPHVCPICLHDFNQKVVLREHVRWVHANKIDDVNGMFACQVCGLRYADREELCAHIVKHSDIMAKTKHKDTSNVSTDSKLQQKPLQKDVTNSEVAEKVVNIKTEQIFVADSTVFSRNYSAEDNLNFSPERNTVECDLCGNKFSSQKELLTHVHIHI